MQKYATQNDRLARASAGEPPRSDRREHQSKALDRAADYYIKMAGDTTAMPTGAVEELMERAIEQGSVTPEEIVTDRCNVSKTP